MKAKLLDSQGAKTFALIFDTGDEVLAGLTEFARRERLAGSHFTAIGAFQDVTLGYERHPAVHHLSGSVERGALMAVCGPNVQLGYGRRAGKSKTPPPAADGGVRVVRIGERKRYFDAWKMNG